MAQRIKVLVVDDSAMMREFLRGIISSQPDMEVLATAGDPYQARDKFMKERPDVITLDIEMPRMDGLTFLQKLMAAHPTPVIMISSLTKAGAEATLKALQYGAVDFVSKPTHNLSDNLKNLTDEILEKIRGAARAKIRRPLLNLGAMEVPQKIEVDQVVALTKTPPRPGGPMVILIGASTGGTVALEQVICRLPADSPPIAIVQHMPEHFTTAFAERLDSKSPITVMEAKDGQMLPPGHCLIAPGGLHMLLDRSGANYMVRVKDGPRVNRHKPSVDVLFRSGVNHAGPNAVAIIMTGMGDDGAKGMKDLHDVGALTVAQNEATCTVYGMPKVAVQLGGVDRIVPLDRIAPLIVGLWENQGRRAK